jgi:hypothetical protein
MSPCPPCPFLSLQVHAAVLRLLGRMASPTPLDGPVKGTAVSKRYRTTYTHVYVRILIRHLLPSVIQSLQSVLYVVLFSAGWACPDPQLSQYITGTAATLLLHSGWRTLKPFIYLTQSALQTLEICHPLLLITASTSFNLLLSP